MASINPINFLSNRNGIPRIASTSVSVNTADVTFNFSSDFTFSRNFNGLVLVKLDQPIPSGTTTTLPILLSSSIGTQPVVTKNGVAVTVSEITGTGIYLMYFDRLTSTLQLIA